MPPVAVTVAAPVLLPKHNTLLPAVVVDRAVGCDTLTELMLVQALASVTVTVLGPILRLVITEVVAEVDHK